MASQNIALIDARGNRHSFTYDAVGRKTAAMDALGRITTSGYDAAGRQNLRLDPRGYATTYTHDAIDQQTGRLYPDGSRVTMSYDQVGNRILMVDATGIYTTTYDGLQRRVVSIKPPGCLTYSYDPTSNLASMVSRDGRTTYGYDALGLLAFARNPSGEIETNTYDAAQQRTLERFADGSRASYTFDSVGRLFTRVDLRGDESVISGVDYLTDGVGNRIQMRGNTGQITTWAYDKTNQLVMEHRTGTGGFHNTMTYDASGNRLVKNASGALTTSTFDAANQLQTTIDSTGTTTYTFDAAGNQRIVQAPAKVTTNTWNYENQQVGIQSTDGTLVTMMYNADFRRVYKEP